MKALAPIAALAALLVLSACGMMETERSLAQDQGLRIYGDPVTIYPGQAAVRGPFVE